MENPSWEIVDGRIVSGRFETEREEMMADAINKIVGKLLYDKCLESYERGFEAGKAIYEPKTWLGRLFG